MSDDEFSKVLADKTAELKRRSIRMSKHVTEDDKATVTKYESEMNKNKTVMDDHMHSIEKISQLHHSVGWFDLIYIVLVVILVNYAMGIFINIFHK